jgi:SecD/SecF fusion protein
LGIFSIIPWVLPFSLEIDQAFIAAILTVIGYSINDTVIVYDRIREFLHIHPKRTLHDNMDQAMNSTLRRTMNTSLTTIVVLLVIFFFGGANIGDLYLRYLLELALVLTHQFLLHRQLFLKHKTDLKK